MELRPIASPVFVGSLALLGLTFVTDWWAPVGFTFTAFYLLPVFFVARLASSIATLSVASTASFLILLVGLSGPMTWVAFSNRGCILLILWGVTVLTVRHSGRLQLRQEYQDIEEQVQQRTADLVQTNRDLNALREEAASLLAALVKSSDDAIIGMTLSGTVQSWNAGAEHVFGYSPQEIIGRSISSLCPPDRLDEVPAMLSQIAHGEHVRNVETIQRKKQGHRIDVSLTVSPVKDVAGAVVAASAIARDITQRKRIEAALRESEARFHMMADTAPVMVWMAEPESGCTFVNKRWLDFTGRTMEQESGYGWFNGMHPQDHARCRAIYRTAIVQKQPFTMEYRLRRADGTYRWLLDTGVPRFEADGTLSGHIGSCIDLTERKMAEQMLQEMNTALANAMPGIARLDQDGGYLAINDLYAGALGYEPSELIGRNWSRTISCEDQPKANAAYQLMLDEGKGEFEAVGVRKDGSTFWKQVLMVKILDRDGEHVGHYCFMRDISDRKRSEAALRESEARFHMMADTAPVMVWMSGLDAGCVFFNKRWLEFTGRTLEEESGQGWFEGVHPHDQQRCRDTYRAAQTQGQPFTMEYRLRRADGVYRWILDTGVPRFEPDGVISGYIGSCIDLTERKEMEDELRKTIKERESLLREVHHRVKNNLQVISSLLNLQMASIKDPQIVQLFRECQIRISSIALLHEALHRSNDLSHINMAEYARTLTGHLFRSYGVNDETIGLTLSVKDMAFDVDTAMTCGLIIDELVSNCLKHAFIDGRSGHIGIDLWAHDDGTYTLRVSDDGVGIPKDGTLTNQDSLGLELVGLMAEKLDGTLHLQSGQGTEWQIHFHPLRYQERM
jgi:PAS domain S-box-containing protein